MSAHEQKIKAWRQQHAAFGAPSYRISLVPRDPSDPDRLPWNYGKGRGPDGTEKFFSSAEVAELLPFLAKKNVSGYDIYVTPINEDEYFILIDDVRQDKLAAVRQAGFSPSLIQMSSDNNYQIILRVSRFGQKTNEAANQVLVDINRQFGDPNITSVVRPFRMAGFANKKPGRNNFFTRIVESRPDIYCPVAAKMLEDEIQKRAVVKQQIATKPKVTPSSKNIKNPSNIAQNTVNSSVDEAYRQERDKLVQKYKRDGFVIDESKIDFNVAKNLLRKGFSEEEVEDAILNGSPNLESRHHNPMRWANHQVQSASKALFQEGAPRAAGVSLQDED